MLNKPSSIFNNVRIYSYLAQNQWLFPGPSKILIAFSYMYIATYICTAGLHVVVLLASTIIVRYMYIHSYICIHQCVSLI